MASLGKDAFRAILDRVCNSLTDEGFIITEQRPIDYGVSLVLAGGGMLNLYNGKKGPKAVLAGKLIEAEKTRLDAIVAPILGTGAPKAKASQASAASNLFQHDKPWIGCDESGKGDYFGALVVAAVLVRPDQVEELAEVGVRDGKKISDRRSLQLASWIEQHCPHAIRVLMPEDYNERYAGNLNELLSELHAETIGKLATKYKVASAISDQFGSPARIESFLQKNKVEIKLISLPRAEADMAVAAASIIARARFLDSLRELGAQATFELPPGAGPKVEATARELVRLCGKKHLGAYAKLHFRTTEKL